MLDIKLLRENLDLVRTSVTNRKGNVELQIILDLDAKRRDLIFELDQIKKQRNENSGKIGKGAVSAEEKKELIQLTRDMGDKIKSGNVELKEIEEEIYRRILPIPNILHESTPVGKDEEDNVEIRKWKEVVPFDFPPKHHADLGEKLDILDVPRGVKIAQSRFTLVKGAGARLERALISFMLDLHTQEHGYQEMLPPLLVNAKSMTGTGQLPKFEEDLFKTTDGLYLIPSAEVPLTNIFADEILKEDQLPQYVTAFTPCFRSEAGSYGRDTKGYIRQHQFNKVELVKFVHPDSSFEELEKLVNNAEEVLKQLELPYRVLELCSGDIGFSAAKCYDLEVWLPSEGQYREISSCSNCTDFQARRANIKFKPKEGGKARFVHTLNGSGLAVGRTVVAILENYQQADGSIKIPKVLISYMGGLTEIKLPR
ncbi:MAG: serine--tRNA ligase [SAR324 cluster bacterium]|uniref:Serine--tRNA ligase n=1 Tax=SAR324 cluster bacterium TaxID=2024889 RepID=A0A2A4SUT0_9DELT|nr:MAG: serine--tRNA ligase [SAR324 cluster bacterium]